MTKSEAMTEFFAARLEEYDAHMLSNVVGCREGYLKMAALLPTGIKRLLDLGCGTGLELDEIFKHFPDLAVTGIDLSAEMLAKLKAKHGCKRLSLLCGDYFVAELGKGEFDCAVSFETLHHFSRERKVGLYRRIRKALTAQGCYIECDYMAADAAEEAALSAENARLRAEQGIDAEAFYHIDIPFTAEHQREMLLEAGFARVREVFRMGGTVMLVAEK